MDLENTQNKGDGRLKNGKATLTRFQSLTAQPFTSGSNLSYIRSSWTLRTGICALARATTYAGNDMF